MMSKNHNIMCVQIIKCGAKRYFCTAKETRNKTKRQTTEWEKYTCKWIKWVSAYKRRALGTAKDTYRLESRDGKKVFHADRYDKKVGVTIFISDKMDFKT